MPAKRSNEILRILQDISLKTALLRPVGVALESGEGQELLSVAGCASAAFAAKRLFVG